MKKKIIVSLLVFFLVYLTSPFSLYAHITDYLVGPLDVLQIEIWDNADLSREVSVSLKGAIFLPLIGEVIVKNLTSKQIQKIIRNDLADGYLVDPQVTVTVKEYNSKKIYVLGEVNKPGYYPFSKETTFVELISMVGGLTQNAGQEAFIIRTLKGCITEKNKIQRRNLSEDPSSVSGLTPLSKEAIDNSQVITISLNDLNHGINLNFELRNMDTLYIPKAKFFYIIGEVNSPGRFKLEKKMNVLQAISMAGGLTQKANVKKPKIIRAVKGKEQEIKVGMTDPVLPNDIIKVPESFF